MTDIETKKAHALAIVEAIEAVKADIEAADPDPWFGGLPPLYVQLNNALGFHANAIREKFALGSVTPSNDPGYTPAAPSE